MRAYAIFAGGGAKGAALAGCLQAAQTQGIIFEGFGGTSAGSVVAFLAAVGHSGDEIRDAFLAHPPAQLLPDKGDQLKVILRRLNSAKVSWRRGDSFSKCSAVLELMRVLYPLRNKTGIYGSQGLRQFLCDRASAKLGMSPTEIQQLRFDRLPEGFSPLRIVASNFAGGCPAVFPRDLSDANIVDCVCASAAYPFVFGPIEIGKQLLWDGGVASNLPSFLYSYDARSSRLPTLAFDISATPGEAPSNMFTLAERLLATSLGASDVILREVAEGVKHIPIKLPPNVGTLDFDAKPDALENLFDTGYRQATEALMAFDAIRISKNEGLALREQLMAQYGDRKLYAPVLTSVVRDVETVSDAREVRANIMLATGRGTRIVVYHHGMTDAPDLSLELAEEAGCSGDAWKSRRPAVANLEVAVQEPELWGMTREQHQRVPANRKSMLSVPIPGRLGDFVAPQLEPFQLTQ